ncbi:ArsR family transcriptional regulator [Neorhizobium galegae]|uniref:sulfite-sensing transcriptional repressor BigR n=2 Tax=Rhizobium/Agrobacterium group TaxID=227290 RepID=UPI003D7C2FE0|nr:ArsR family transcriptional regulator [Neorhizobium galegae]
MDFSSLKAMSGMTPQAMEARATEVAGHLKVLAHPARLMLVCTLVEGEYSVGALEEKLDLHQPTLSQQLTVLREAGIVETRKEGKQVFYRLTEAKTAQLIAALFTIFCADEVSP